MVIAVRAALVLSVLAWSTTARATSDDELASLLAQSLDRAEALVEDGQVAEGVYVGSVVASLYPDNPRVQQLVQTGYEARVRSKVLGYNLGRRVPREKVSAARRILLYVPDRVLDLLDVLTVRLSVGPQIGFRAHATHALQANAFAGTTVGAGIGQKHFAGVDAETRVDVALGPVGPKVVGGFRLGTTLDAAGGLSVVQLPTNQLYDNYRDYWALGGGVGLLFVGAEAEVHPFEVGDFLVGVFGGDLLRDDLASTQRLRLRDGDGALYRKLANRVRKGRLRRFLAAYPTLPTTSPE
ncbi:MAG: hypothetical protein ACI8PZ_007506 [Myxococcota bacterium]|jgi:hypothetical protein